MNEYLRYVGRWLLHVDWGLRSLKSLGLFVIVLLSAYAVAIGSTPNPVFRAQIASATLQADGIISVALGLRRHRRLSRLPSALDGFRSWLTRRPRLHPRHYAARSNARISGGLSVNASGHHLRGVPPGASIEERLEVLEANLSTLERQVGQFARSIREGNSNPIRSRRAGKEGPTGGGYATL